MKFRYAGLAIYRGGGTGQREGYSRPPIIVRGSLAP